MKNIKNSKTLKLILAGIFAGFLFSLILLCTGVIPFTLENFLVLPEIAVILFVFSIVFLGLFYLKAYFLAFLFLPTTVKPFKEKLIAFFGFLLSLVLVLYVARLLCCFELKWLSVYIFITLVSFFKMINYSNFLFLNFKKLQLVTDLLSVLSFIFIIYCAFTFPVNELDLYVLPSQEGEVLNLFSLSIILLLTGLICVIFCWLNEPATDTFINSVKHFNLKTK